MGTLSVDKLLKTSTGAAEFTLPATDGSSGQAWVSDGSGQLSVGEVTAAGIATDAVGTSEIAALAVTATQIAASTITPAQMANSAFLSNRNVIINGNFDIWQRGTSFAAIAAAAYSADRYKYYKVGAAVHTITRETDVPTQAESGSKSNYSVKIDCTTVDSSIAAGDEVNFRQTVEGYNLQSLMGNTATLSFWVKGTKTGIHCVSFVNSGTNRSYVVEYTISVTDTWEKKTITVAFSDSGGTWDYTNGTGVIIMWSLAAGTTFHTTAGAWQTGNYRSTSNQVNACDSTSNNFFLSQVQLEVSPTATPFEQKTYGQELAACQRYFCKTFAQSVAPANGNGVVNGARVGKGVTTADTEPFTTWQYPVTMRASPTIVLYNHRSGGTAGQWDNHSNASGANARSIFGNEESIRIDNADVKLALANAWMIHATASSEL